MVLPSHPVRSSLEAKVRARATVTDGFSASHRTDEPQSCQSLHGHDWTVEVSIEGEISPKTHTVGEINALHHALAVVCRELRFRDLNDMLPGVPATAEGIAAYIHERLVLEFPTLTRVSVSMGRLYTATLEWQRR